MLGDQVTDAGLTLVKLCASEFFFVSAQVAEFLGMFADSPTRIAAITSLLMRTVDYMNWTSQVPALLTSYIYYLGKVVLKSVWCPVESVVFTCIMHGRTITLPGHHTVIYRMLWRFMKKTVVGFVL